MAVAVSLDRQEKATDTATESAIQVRRRRIRERKGRHESLLDILLIDQRTASLRQDSI